MAQSPPPPSSTHSIFIRVLALVRKHWFIAGIVTVITLARLAPWIGVKHGPLHPEITVKYVAVSVIFLNSGLSLKTEELTKAIGQVRLHLFIQGYTLVFIPFVITILVTLLKQTDLVPTVFLNGLQVVGCMPPPVSSAVILTKAVGGNEAAAIFNSAMGSFLGIVITPILLLVLVGTSTQIPFLSIFTQLSLTVLVPLVTGQLVRQAIKQQLEKWALPYGTISSCILLTIIYTTFCDTFSGADTNITLNSVILVASLVIVIQGMFLFLAYTFTSLSKKFDRVDIVAVLFCSTHKSLTLGIPILKIVFHQSPDLSSLSLPLLVYHPTQILLGSSLVPFLQSWIRGGGDITRENSPALKV